MDTLIQNTIGERLLHDGENFNVTNLEAERQRISSLLRNNGFIISVPEFITYQADTIMNPGKVALRIMTKPDCRVPLFARGRSAIYQSG